MKPQSWLIAMKNVTKTWEKYGPEGWQLKEANDHVAIHMQESLFEFSEIDQLGHKIHQDKKLSQIAHKTWSPSSKTLKLL